MSIVFNNFEGKPETQYLRSKGKSTKKTILAPEREKYNANICVRKGKVQRK